MDRSELEDQEVELDDAPECEDCHFYMEYRGKLEVNKRGVTVHPRKRIGRIPPKRSSTNGKVSEKKGSHDNRYYKPISFHYSEKLLDKLKG